MKFKKGQIVPRWLNVRAEDRKAQHCIRFGGDVSYEDGVLFLESDGKKDAVFMSNGVKRRLNNGTYKNSPFHLTHVHIDCSRVQKGGFIQCAVD